MLDNYVILYIINILDDYSKSSFIRTNKMLYKMKKYTIFSRKYSYIKIIGAIENGYNFKKIKLCTNNTNIPKCITHLKFDFEFDQNVKNCISNSVTHLIFG